jgi:hypothetical protein
MDNLERYIAENRDLFDSSEPGEGHFDRFRERMDRVYGPRKRQFNNMMFMKIAAGILVLITGTLFIFDLTGKRTDKELSGDVQEAVNYYDNSAQDHLRSIRKLACCGQDSKSLYNMASGEINALDENARELKKTLAANPDDERVQSALIRNQQMKETVMKNMIRQMNQAKK